MKSSKKDIIETIVKKVEFDRLISCINPLGEANYYIISLSEPPDYKETKLYPKFFSDKKFINKIISEDRKSDTETVTVEYKDQIYISHLVKIKNEPIAFVLFGPLNSKIAEKNNRYTKKILMAIGKLLCKLYIEEKTNNSHMERLSALYQIGTSLSSSMDKQKTLKMVVRHAKGLLGAQNCSLMLIDKDSQTLNIVVGSGLSRSIIKNTKLKIGEGIAGKTALSGKAVLLQKGFKAKGSQIEGNAEEIPSAISVPIKIQNKVIGVINVSKSIDGENFTKEQQELLVMFANQAAIAIENSRLMEELQELFVQSITALANAIDARDRYTRGHSQRVTTYSLAIAKGLNMSKEDRNMLQYAALLHDIGKINIKDSILNKPDKLSEEEFSEMQRHPEYGAKIMEPVKRFSSLLPYMYYHHEKFAGEGYPFHLRGEEIPLIARIIAVADSFDAITSDRPYRKGKPISYAIEELKKCSGTQFDPEVVEVFLKWIEEKGEDFIKRLMKKTKTKK